MTENSNDADRDAEMARRSAALRPHIIKANIILASVPILSLLLPLAASLAGYDTIAFVLIWAALWAAVRFLLDQTDNAELTAKVRIDILSNRVTELERQLKGLKLSDRDDPAASS